MVLVTFGFVLGLLILTYIRVRWAAGSYLKLLLAEKTFLILEYAEHHLTMVARVVSFGRVLFYLGA